MLMIFSGIPLPSSSWGCRLPRPLRASPNGWMRCVVWDAASMFRLPAVEFS